jgi:hypothetical protein
MPDDLTPHSAGVFRSSDAIIATGVHTMRNQDFQLEPDPVIEAYKKDVDRSLIRENLKLTVQERIDKLIHLIEFQQELRDAMRDAERNK